MKNPLKHKVRGPVLWAHIVFAKLIAIKTLLFNIAALKVLVVNSALLMGIFQFVPHITFASTSVDISVSNLADPTVIAPGGSASFQYFYKNESSNPYVAVNNVVMTVVLPDGFTAGGSNPSWNSQVGNTFTYNIPNGSGEFMVYLNAMHTSGPNGIYENTVSVASNTTDSYPDNNSASSSVLVIDDPEQTTDLAITSFVSDGSFIPGESLSYTINYQNMSSDTAYGVNVLWEADDMLTSLSFSNNDYSASGSLYNRYIPSLAPGELGQITINATLSPLITSAYTVDSYVNIYGTLSDSNEGNNSSSVSDPAQVNSFDVDILSDSTSLCLGSSYDMDLVFNSEGLKHPSITVTFPGAIHFVSATDTPTGAGGGAYEWTIPSASFGITSFTVEANSLSAGATIVATIGDSGQTPMHTSSTAFTITNCGNTNGGGNNGGNQGSNNNGGSTGSTPPSTNGGNSSTPPMHNAAKDGDFVKLQCIDENGLDVYNYARSHNITTMDSIGDARMCDEINRLELAKMLSNYIQHVLHIKPDTSRHCDFSDANTVLNTQDRAYMTTACQLGVMGLKYDGSPDTIFHPYNKVTRDIFATAFDRLLNGGANDGNATCWYCYHMVALEKAKIITHNDPKIIELRAFIMLMMMRADQYRK